TVLVLAHSNAAVDAAAVALVRNLTSSDGARERKVTGEALRAGEPFLQEAQSLPVTERAVLQRSRPELVARLETLEGRGGVLVDEASMAQPPQVALAASLATRGVAVFGDFRQLAPVVQSWSRPVRQWLGRDVFELNGLVRNVDTTPILSVLDVQYRMHPKIM